MPYSADHMQTQRERLGLKRADFAKRIGISYGHYRNVEYGTKPAAIEVFHRIARELRTPVDDLLADPPDQPRIPERGAA
ncbi:MAG: helix-turn-helix domain-containing protein [Streptosporangiales bacterium]